MILSRQIIRCGDAMRYRPADRNGVLTVCVLVCLTISATIMIVIAGSALRARRNVQFEHQMAQTGWLLDAGIIRARNQLKGQLNYSGETWKPTGAIEDFGTAEVEITVTADTNEGRTINVTATIVESAARARTTRRSQRVDYPIISNETFNVESSDEDE